MFEKSTKQQILVYTWAEKIYEHLIRQQSWEKLNCHIIIYILNQYRVERNIIWIPIGKQNGITLHICLIT